MKTDQYFSQHSAQVEIDKLYRNTELQVINAAIQLRIANALERIADKMEQDK
jgi:hypothetical protein